MTRSKLSRVASRTSFRSIGATPALFTRRSSRPKCRVTSARSRRGALSSPISTRGIKHFSRRRVPKLRQAGFRIRFRTDAAHGKLPSLPAKGLRASQANPARPSRHERDAGRSDAGVPGAGAHGLARARLSGGAHQSASERSGTLTHARLWEDSSPFSASCTPFAPSRSIHRKGSPSDHVAQEKLPLRLEGIVVLPLLRNFLPAVEKKSMGLGMSGFQTGARGCAVWLDPAVAKAGHRGTECAIHLQGQEVISSHAHVPGGVELGNDPARKLERAVRSVIRVGL